MRTSVRVRCSEASRAIVKLSLPFPDKSVCGGFFGGNEIMKRLLYCVAALTLAAQTAAATSMDRVLAKLDPEERAHQACTLLGVDKVRKDKALPHADRMQSGVLGPAKFTGTRVTTVGGAVRADHRWYRLSFDCTVTPDQMKATAFSYTIGPEIPRAKWEDIGLWP
jgi:hypothetical protein